MYEIVWWVTRIVEMYIIIYYEIGSNNLQMCEVISCVNIYTWAVELEIYEGHPILKYYISWSKEWVFAETLAMYLTALFWQVIKDLNSFSLPVPHTQLQCMGHWFSVHGKVKSSQSHIIHRTPVICVSFARHYLTKPDHGFGASASHAVPFYPFFGCNGIHCAYPRCDSEVELTWVAKRFTCLQTVTHPSSHRARCKSLTHPLKQIPLKHSLLVTSFGAVTWRIFMNAALFISCVNCRPKQNFLKTTVFVA